MRLLSEPFQRLIRGADHSSLPLSRQTLTYATGVVRRHRQAIGSKGRCPLPGVQALMTWSTCAKARPTPNWASDSPSPPPRGTTSTRPSTYWQPAHQTRRDAGQSGQGRAAVPGAGRHPDLDRPDRRQPAPLPGNIVNLQVIATPDRDTAMGVGTAARLGPRPHRGPDLGRHPGTGRHRAARAGRQGLPGRRRAHPHALQGTRQARTAKDANRSVRRSRWLGAVTRVTGHA